MKNKGRLLRYIDSLGNADPAKRRAAAVRLSELDERAAYPLIKALRDESPGVQDSAMRSLIALGGESTAYMMLPLLREDSYLRNTAMIVLRGIAGDSTPVLYPLLKDKDDDIRKFAVDLLSDIKERVAPEKIMPLLRDGNANVRAAAARAMGVLGFLEAVPALVGALRDEEWVCFSALESLALLKDERSAGPIAELLSAASEAIRFAAIDALGLIGSPCCSESLIHRLNRTEGLEKNMILKNLIRIGTIPPIPGISGALDGMLKGGDWEEKLLAIEGLVLLGDIWAIPAIVDAAGSLDASDPENEIKVMRIKDGLRRFGRADALVKLLDDPAIRYRGRVIAIEIIGDLLFKPAVPYLEKIIAGDQRDVRRAGIKAIGQIDAGAAQETLLTAVTDRDGHVRRAAVAALAKIGGERAFNAVSLLLGKEEYEDVMEEAVTALLRMDEERFFASVDGLRPEIRELASRLMQEI